ncbi:hypothetical protein [Burkholderia cenocepacia]|uniref:hypothetical protein n=1 Tax=Burkholderia cenocepacia TaxID=95486 RepID=UPI001BA33938|nr:hypothetical protein [Burkholderia cenocepacia]MBR8428966.1 hypothetical protein [Burkholderia cenocepacia]
MVEVYGVANRKERQIPVTPERLFVHFLFFENLRLPASLTPPGIASMKGELPTAS